MDYAGYTPAPSEQSASGRIHVRLTFFKRPDGSVRQFSERASDGGRTWHVNHDLICTRRESAPR